MIISVTRNVHVNFQCDMLARVVAGTCGPKRSVLCKMYLGAFALTTTCGGLSEPDEKVVN